ncbi:MAG: sporulation transcriptional regulator SpoIIID [Oscillospiraceae bacterium]|nr:sporulation transcriptional regulator SpoIIID [Oscillospiraceae bacterium]
MHAAESRAQALDDRALQLGAYIAEHCATVRNTAAVFGISKSTVHKDVTVRLPALHAGLYAQVREIIEKNKQERHIRGGLATKRKYERLQRSSREPRPRSGLLPRSTENV